MEVAGPGRFVTVDAITHSTWLDAFFDPWCNERQQWQRLMAVFYSGVATVGQVSRQTVTCVQQGHSLHLLLYV